MSVFSVLIEQPLVTFQRWAAQLKSLRLKDNFGACIVTDVVVPPGKEVPVSHTLGKRPSYVLFSRARYGVLERGTTEDDAKYVYIYNRSSSTIDAVVDVIMLP